MHLIRSMRPRQWTKNLLVFAGLIFGQKLQDPHSIGLAVAAFGVFCLLSSTVYLINDVRDRDADRLHPAEGPTPDRLRRARHGHRALGRRDPGRRRAPRRLLD